MGHLLKSTLSIHRSSIPRSSLSSIVVIVVVRLCNVSASYVIRRHAMDLPAPARERPRCSSAAPMTSFRVVIKHFDGIPTSVPTCICLWQSGAAAAAAAAPCHILCTTLPHGPVLIMAYYTVLNSSQGASSSVYFVCRGGFSACLDSAIKLSPLVLTASILECATDNSSFRHTSPAYNEILYYYPP